MNNETLRIFGKGFNYSQDGPGNRLVYHLVGCNMRCPWCSNPEGMDMTRQGREIREISLETVKHEILSASPLFYDGGGVTFTGGEATLQFEQLYSLLSFCKERGIHTAIETNATHPRLPELFPLLDYLMADLKHYDLSVLSLHTGYGGKEVFSNMQEIAREGINALIRIPLIHGFNDRPEDTEGFLHFFLSMKALVPEDKTGFSVELLPYHEYGKGKWEKLGLSYGIENGFIDPAYEEKLSKTLQQNEIRLQRT